MCGQLSNLNGVVGLGYKWKASNCSILINMHTYSYIRSLKVSINSSELQKVHERKFSAHEKPTSNWYISNCFILVHKFTFKNSKIQTSKNKKHTVLITCAWNNQSKTVYQTKTLYFSRNKLLLINSNLIRCSV